VALEENLKKQWPDHFVKVYTAMRYWIPFADTTLNEIREDGITHVVLLPLYPHFSWTTSGSSFRDWENVKKEQASEGKPVSWEEFYIKSYHLNTFYLEAINTRIDESLDQLDPEVRNQTHLIFSAHGTPVSEVESGDPYTKQIDETVEAIMESRSRKEQYWLSFQSRVGPMKWTQPNTEELVKRLLDYGITNFLLIPVAFVTDHIETLCELNIELRETLEEEGYHVNNLKVMQGLNDHPLFIKALTEEVGKQLSHLIPADNISKNKQKQSKSIVSP
jgi:ferrochelatase